MYMNMRANFKGNAEQRQKAAEQARSPLNKFQTHLAKFIGATPETDIVRPRIKNLDRIFEKAAGRCDGDINQLTDICACRILFNDNKQIHTLRELADYWLKWETHPTKVPYRSFIKNWEDKEFRITEIDDNFAKPKKHGYRGMNLTVMVPLNKNRSQLCEIQIMHEQMQLTDKITHAAYEAIRSTKEKAVAQGRELSDEEREMVENYMQTIKTIYDGDASNYGLKSLEIPTPSM